MQSVKSEQKVVKCPYNSSHQIIAHKMQTHLVKCKKNYPDVTIVNCMFNSTHKIPEPELQYHHEICKDKRNFDKFVFESENVNENRFPLPKVDIACGDNWDTDNYPTYNPEEYCETRPVLRMKKCEPPSVRKDFRVRERLRIQQLKENENSPSTSKNSEQESSGYNIKKLMQKISEGSGTSIKPKRNE